MTVFNVRMEQKQEHLGIAVFNWQKQNKMNRGLCSVQWRCEVNNECKEGKACPWVHQLVELSTAVNSVVTRTRRVACSVSFQICRMNGPPQQFQTGWQYRQLLHGLLLVPRHTRRRRNVY